MIISLPNDVSVTCDPRAFDGPLVPSHDTIRAGLHQNLPLVTIKNGPKPPTVLSYNTTDVAARGLFHINHIYPLNNVSVTCDPRVYDDKLVPVHDRI
jgi:hypothetical protein